MFGLVGDQMAWSTGLRAASTYIMYVGYKMNQTPAATAPVRPNSGRRAAHVQDTRRALLDTARRLFTRDGFQATRTEEIVEESGLTRGALYHHFRDKEDLFRAVHEEVLGEVAPLLWRRGADRTASAWTLFRANSDVYLEAASTNEAYRQIVLIDGPAVLGAQYLSERRDGPTRKIADYLRQAVDEGVLEPQPIDPLAHLLSALGTGSAMYVAQAEDPGQARRQITECYERFLVGLGITDGPHHERGS
jgi:AcrR family transcriptional regulator